MLQISKIDESPFSKRPQPLHGGVIFFVSVVLYLLWCWNGACWPSKRRPGWHDAVEDEKSLRLWDWRIEQLSPERHAAMLPLHSSPSKQATSVKYTPQSQKTLENGAGLWIQMEKRKKYERSTVHLLSGPLSTERKQTQCHTINHTVQLKLK